MQLLFSKSSNKQTAASKLGSPATESRWPCLLILLTHWASWTTLHHCLQNLRVVCNQNYDPAAVLDFLWALTFNPKLLQGCEKFTPKHHSPEDTLGLTSAQVGSVLFLFSSASILSIVEDITWMWSIQESIQYYHSYWLHEALCSRCNCWFELMMFWVWFWIWEISVMILHGFINCTENYTKFLWIVLKIILTF
jgi:hypothetical protein